MALRPGRTVRDADKPAWTRYSRKKPRKSYIKAMPHQELRQFRMGARREDYEIVYHLVSEENMQIRDNALESARQALNKYLEKHITGKYFFLVRIFPHQVIRENKMIAGAGADRLQKGMRRAFGKPTDKAARVKPGQAIFTVFAFKGLEKHIITALERAKRKLPGLQSIEQHEVTPEMLRWIS
jgi:large subunit ribosomal protein L10e